MSAAAVTQKVLVIDDDETIRSIIQAILESYEFETYMAENGENGLEIAESQIPSVIILDQKMPGLKGDDVLRKLKKIPQTKEIPVLMISSENNISLLSKSLELGAKDYIVKPFNGENLITRIQNVLH